MKTALHVLGRIERSGMERMLASSHGFWEEHNWEIKVLSLSDVSEYQVALMKLGYKIENLPSPWSAKGIIRMARIFREINPDILHNHVERRHAIISLVAYFSINSAGRVRTVHSNFPDKGLRHLIRRAQNLIELFTRFTIVVPSSDVQMNEKELWNRDTVVIENWAPKYDTREDLPSSSDVVRMTILGNCSPVKRHEIAFGLAQDISGNETFDIRLAVHHVGSSEYASEHENRILSSSPDNYRIEVHGSVSDPQEILRRSDCLVITSSREGQSVSMLEAIRMGIPCIAIAVPGLQWAKDIDSIFLAENEFELLNTFRKFLDFREKTSINKISPELDIRFSPFRGVSEYCKVYEEKLQNEN